jgi:hypothetical protein
VIARAGILPFEDRAKKLFNNLPALFFMDKWQSQVESEQMLELGRLLGVYWTIDDVEAMYSEREQWDPEDESKNKRVEKAMFPMLTILKPEFDKVVKQLFGRKFGHMAPEWAKDEENFVDLYDAPQSAFKQFVEEFVSKR